MSKFVARFLGSPPINFIPGRLDGDESGLAVRCGENAVFALPRDRAAALASRAGSDVILGVRPEHITGGSHGSSRREHVVSHNVTIESVQPTGTRLYGAFALAGTEVLAELQAHDVERPGETIEVLFDMQRAILIDPENERVLGLEWQSTGAVTARAEQLAGLGPAYLSCYFDARHAGAEAMRGFRAVADTLGCQLALEAVVPDLDNPGEALRSIAELASAAGVRFGAVAVSPAEDLGFVIPGTVFDDMSPYETLFSAAREAFPDSAVGGGNFMYFTELNRKPPPFEGLDFVIHSTCAIVHAADDRSVTETVQTLPYIINSGRSLFGGKPYCLGPVGIGTRTSPFGGGPAPNPHSGRVTMCRNDPRQRGLLGAAWHLGIAARAAEGGVDSLILGAPTGDHGVLHHPGDTPQPWFDEHGGRFPVWHVMRGVYAASGQPRRATEVSVPREVQALAFETEAALELWVANLMGEERRVRLDGLGAGIMRVAVLDEESFVACAGDPEALDGVETSASGDHIELRPYAVARCRME